MKVAKLRALVLVVVTAMALAGASGKSSAAPAAPGKPIELRVATHMSAKHCKTIAEKEWTAEIERLTGGRVKFIFFTDASLVSATKAHDAVLSGVTDIGVYPLGHLPGMFPLTEVMNQPVGLNSTKAAIWAGWELMKSSKVMQDEWKSVKVLSACSLPPYALMTTKPVRNLEDLRGKEVKASGRAVHAMKALGGVPVDIPITATYVALQKGTIGGHWCPPTDLKQWKIADVCRYITLDHFLSITHYTTMNLGVWNSLPADVKKIIDSKLDDLVTREMNGWIETNDLVIKEWFPKQGGTVIQLTPEERARWTQRLEPVTENWVKSLEAKGLPARDTLKEFQRLLVKYK